MQIEIRYSLAFSGLASKHRVSYWLLENTHTSLKRLYFYCFYGDNYNNGHYVYTVCHGDILMYEVFDWQKCLDCKYVCCHICHSLILIINIFS